jgi:hypothetical protein
MAALPAGVPPLPRPHGALLARLLAALDNDPRVLAAWLIGSLARSAGDEYSDLDLLLAVEDAALPALADGWRDFLAGVAPTVYAQRLGAPDKPTITAVTPEWLRFDLTLAAASRQAHGYSAAVLLFDRAGVAERATFGGRSAADPLARLPDLAADFIRSLGLLPVIAGREEYFVGQEGAAILRRQLVELLVLENDAPRGGVKRLNPLLTAEQRATLAALPLPAPTRAAVIASQLAHAHVFLPRARALLERHGLPYPDEFEQATRRHLQVTLGITV